MGDEVEPLLPKWKEAQGKSDALKKGMKPDITSPIKKFDQDLVEADKLIKEKKKLKDILTDFDSKISSLSGKYEKLVEQRDKVKEEDDKKFEQYSGELEGFKGEDDPDPAAVIKTLNGYVDASNDYTTMTKALNDQISKLDCDAVSLFKKARDEYKSKSDSIEARAKKLEADAKSQLSQIKSIALSYEKTATKSSDTDTVKAVRGFVSELPSI